MSEILIKNKKKRKISNEFFIEEKKCCYKHLNLTYNQNSNARNIFKRVSKYK